MGGNFKAKCVDLQGANKDGYTVGKVYEIIDGQFVDDQGSKRPFGGCLKKFEDLVDYSMSKWELVTEKQYSGEYISIKRCKKDKRVVAVLSMDGKFQKSANVKLKDFDGDFGKAAKAAVEKLLGVISRPETAVNITAEDTPLTADGFNVGDRVHHETYGNGTVLGVNSGNPPIAVEFDNAMGGHDCCLLGTGHGKDNHCWWCRPSELKLVETAVNEPTSFDWQSFKSGKCAVHCDTEEKAMEFLKECDAQGIKWADGIKATNKTNFKGASSYGILYFGDSSCLTYSIYPDLHTRDIKIDYIPTKPTVKEVKRLAKPDEYVKIVDAQKVPRTDGVPEYKNGDILKILESENGMSKYGEGYAGNGWARNLYNSEYVVLEDYIPEDKPAVKEINRTAKVNEYVKALRGEGGFIHPDTIYKVERVCGVSVYVTDPTGEYSCQNSISHDNYIILENYNPIKEVKRPAKVGEWIKVIGDGGHPNVKTGEIAKVTSLVEDEHGWVRVNGYKQYGGGCIKLDQYVVLENYQPETTPAVKAEFRKAKVGDKIEVVKKRKCHVSAEIGNIHTVNRVDRQGLYTDNNSIYFWDENEEYIIVEEAKPEVKRVGRQARTGEYVEVINASSIPITNGKPEYKNGDVLKIIEGGHQARYAEGSSDDGRRRVLNTEEYVVLENYQPEVKRVKRSATKNEWIEIAKNADSRVNEGEKYQVVDTDVSGRWVDIKHPKGTNKGKLCLYTSEYVVLENYQPK
jgi:hypothetical protein